MNSLTPDVKRDLFSVSDVSDVFSLSCLRTDRPSLLSLNCPDLLSALKRAHRPSAHFIRLHNVSSGVLESNSHLGSFLQKLVCLLETRGVVLWMDSDQQNGSRTVLSKRIRFHPFDSFLSYRHLGWVGRCPNLHLPRWSLRSSTNTGRIPLQLFETQSSSVCPSAPRLQTDDGLT